MASQATNSIETAFEVLKDRESFLQKISSNTKVPGLISGQIILIFAATFLYGIVMGSYNSWQQAMLSGVKMWLLLLATTLICFPSLYIVQLVLGSKISARQMISILLSGFVMTTILMLAFAPIVLFFQMSGDNYQFLQLLHVFIFIFSGFFGMRLVLEALKLAFEQSKVYPKIGLSVFRLWVIIFGFVGLQLSWNLRPFMGSKDMTFEVFRENTQGNVYSTLLGSLGQLMGISKDLPASDGDSDQGEKQ